MPSLRAMPGMAVATPVFATRPAGRRRPPTTAIFAWEWWYKVQVTDNIIGDPSALLPQPPLGQDTTSVRASASLAGLVKTTSSF